MQFTKLTDKAVLPTRGTKFSAGYDLTATEDFTIHPGQSALVSTGIGWTPEGDWDLDKVGFIWPRSGLAAKHGLNTLAGVIDADYNGEIKVLLHNTSKVTYYGEAGTRIAQLVIQNFRTVSNDTHESVTRDGGFGSTGR